jgi:hypothetical protein
MVAISLLLVGFLGTFTLINRSVGLTRVVADNYVATYLAAEGVEVVKSLIDANYLAERGFFDGFASCTTTCTWEVGYDTNWESAPPSPYSGRKLWYDPISHLYTYAPFGTETPFTRRISVTLSGTSGNELHVISRVEWIGRGGGSSAVSLEDHFYDWYLSEENATSSTSTTP